MIYLIIYLIHIMGALRITAQALLAITPIILAGFAITYEGNLEKIKKPLKTAITIMITATLTLVIIPTRETMYQLSAVYIGKQINNTVQLDTKIQKVAQIIDLKLDKIIKENAQ